MKKLTMAALAALNLALAEPAEEGPGYGISPTVDLTAGTSAIVAAPAAARPRPPAIARSGGFILIRWDKGAPWRPERWTLELRGVMGRASPVPEAVPDRIPAAGGGETWRLPMPRSLPGVSILIMRAPGYRFTQLLVPDLR